MASDPLPAAFREDLRRHGLAFRTPEGYAILPARENSRVWYYCSVAAPEGALEIRVQIVSLLPEPLPEGAVSIARAEPNSLHLAHLAALIHNLSDGRFDGPNVMPEEHAQVGWKADWAAITHIVLAESDFAAGYGECLLLALHRRDVADAYVFFMFDKYDAGRLTEQNLYALAFE